ncbi:phosphoribosylglycinamide formyltransferase [Lysobacter xinjiangensis]|uniref:Phosphoribosylglycinamide formyltransferase n=1 Tax=Cognatilysobacter xinjiangensis TaxID=546892 RepID=A0ABQ3BPV9_9GAMM|nr:phosphoribosylglycinamide formyltransferase [Lysobacter xinjiangensis]GGZ53899.1 phosphoribosylglycinamide formyltransferase [Lysobacter xinjiangensis]
MRLAVLASGRGSNLQAILDAIGDGILDAGVVGVFSDRPKAQALERARAAGIPAIALRPADFDTRDAYDAALFDAIARVQPELVVCAGYMRLLGAAQVEAWHGRMINIHPSLLPLFKGLRTHEQALAAGALQHGASVHFVTAELDGGPVIAQARVAVLPGDDAASLAARVLDREHPLLLATLQLLAARRLRLDGASVEFDGRPLRQPLQLAGMELVEIE